VLDRAALRLARFGQALDQRLGERAAADLPGESIVLVGGRCIGFALRFELLRKGGKSGGNTVLKKFWRLAWRLRRVVGSDSKDGAFL